MSPAALVTSGAVVAVLTVVAALADDAITNATVPRPEDARRKRINVNSLCSGRPLAAVVLVVRVRSPRSSAGGSEIGAELWGTEGSGRRVRWIPETSRLESTEAEAQMNGC